MIAAVAVLTPLVRAFGRRIEGKKTGALPADDGTRDQLQCMEQAIDAMAIDIERISEGQRFTTKLLSGREAALIPVGSPAEVQGSRPG